MPIQERAWLGWVFLLVTAVVGAQQPGYQVADIRVDPCTSYYCDDWAAGSDPTGLLVWGSRFVLLANTRACGYEFFLSDGTPGGTAPLLDIQPGPESSYWSPSVVLGPGGDLYFIANQHFAGYRLWRSDGTPQGTRPVGGTLPYSAFGYELVATETGLFYDGAGADYGTELWFSDGTDAGTHMVKDIRPGTSSSGPLNLTVYEGDVYFSADDGTHGSELWKSDGTTKGTRLVKDISSGSLHSYPQWLTVFAGRLMFIAYDGTHGRELWETNGTPFGTRMVKDIHPTASSSPWDFEVCGTQLFFTADDGTHGRELWVTDGSAAGTRLVKDIAADAWPASDIARMTPLDGVLYFSAKQEATGAELWRSDGTEAGTYLVRDLLPGYLSGGPVVMATVLGKLYLTVVGENGSNSLWQSDGTEAGTAPFVPGADHARSFFECAGLAYFTADTQDHGRELWVTDGTPGGTRPCLNLEPDAQGEGPSRPAWWGDRWYMGADSSAEGGGIWTTNGLASGTTRLKLAQSYWTMDSVDQVTPIGPRVLFSISGTTSTGPYELWATDGTEAGTAPLARLEVPRGPHGRLDGVTVKGKFLLGASDPNGDWELWATDGTEAGTSLVADLCPEWGDSEPHAFASLGSVAYFSAKSPAGTGGQLWRSDGTPAGTWIVKEILDAWGPEEIVVLGNRLYYSYSDGGGWGLWSSDGTESGTASVAQMSEPFGLTTHGGALYFVAWVNGKAVLWRSDGSGSGTTPLKTDLSIYYNSYYGDGVPICSTPMGLLFWALDGTHGNEPWITDGTPEGTRLLKDIWPGTSSSTIAPEFAVLPDGTVAFTASDGPTGLELWRTDGTPEGTVLWFDVAPGSRSSSPCNLTVSNGFLFFDADDGVSGEELWAIPLQAVGGVPDGTGGASPLLVSRDAGDTLSLHWERSCGDSANDYAVYEGLLGDFSGHIPLLCTTEGAASATIAPGAGNRYYLVVPKNPVIEGSYGADGAGQERPPSLAPCTLSQDLRACN